MPKIVKLNKKILLFVFQWVAISLNAQTLSGVVVDADQRKPISGVKVGIENTGIWTVTLEEQVRRPIEDPVEMNFHSRLAVKRIARIKGYREHFKNAFGDEKITEENITKAIATFERTLVSPQSRFDKFISGKKDALSDSEINGLHLFRTKANCINCHNSPYFSDQKFHNLGLTYFGREYEDLGLYNISKKPEDVGKFKTPTLREVSQTAPYMHNGLFPHIRGVINMYNAGMPNEKRDRDNPLAPTKSAMLEKLDLSESELTDLENFLKTLHSYQYKMRPPKPVQ